MNTGNPVHRSSLPAVRCHRSHLLMTAGAPILGRADAGRGMGAPAGLLLAPAGAADDAACAALLGEVRQAGVEPPLGDLEEVLPQRPAGEAVPQEQAAQVGMAGEADPEQVIDLRLLQV